MKKFDLLITGVGGQGNILASDILSEVAIEDGYDVKKTDTLGMAQRGGSVISNVRIASQVFSPLIREGETDILLAFEKLEAARWANYLRPDGIAIINDQALPPLAVSLGNAKYPSNEKIIEILKAKTDRVYLIDGTEKAKALGNARTLNILMLGFVSAFLPFKVSTWKTVISQHLKANVRDINLTAFDLGRKEMRDVRI